MITPSAFDAFLSYSRKDLRFAIALERALERYTPPREIRAERRPVAVCRDQDDLTGAEYHAAIDDHLTRSKKLVVLCSPSSRASEYVNDEIRRFAAIHGTSGIISILLAGVPNNAAGDGDADRLAFPDALCELVAMPLAISYAGFEPDRDRVNTGVFYGAWYTLLANLLDVDRAAIEERDRRRKARVRNTWIGGTSGVVVALSALTVWALVERQTAIRRGQVTLAQRLAAEARVVTTLEPDAAQQRATLGVEAVRRLDALGEPTYDAATALREASALLARRAVHLDAGQRDLVFSGDGMTAVAARGPDVAIYDLRSGQRAGTVTASSGASALFGSADGRLVGAVTEDGRLSLWRGPHWRAITAVPGTDSARVVCGGVSPDGRYVAALAADRTNRRRARLLAWHVESGRLVSQERLSLSGDTLLGQRQGDCLQVGSEYLVARYRSQDTATTIDAAVWQWRPASEADPRSFRIGGPNRAPPWQQRALSQVAWATDSSWVAMLDGAGMVATRPLAGGDRSVDRGRESVGVISADGEILVRRRWENDPYVPLLTAWTFTALDRRSGAMQGVVAETSDAFALAPDGSVMVTGGGHRLRLWRTQDGRELMRIGSALSVERMTVGPSARYIAAWDTAGAVDIWDVGHPSELLRVPRGRVAAASADGRRVAVGTALGILVADVATGRIVANVSLDGGAALVALSDDGRYLVAAGGNPRGIELRPDLLRGVVLDLSGAPDTVLAGAPATAAEFSPDGRSLLLGTTDGAVTLIELPGGRVRWTRRFPEGRATRFTLSGDGSVAAAAIEPAIRSSAVAVALSTATGAELRRVVDRASNAIALSSDGKELATAASALVEVTRLADGAVVTRLPHPPTLATVRTVAFLSGNRVMTVGGNLASTFFGVRFFTEQAVLVWDRASGAIAHRLPEGTDRAGEYAATLGEENKPYLADVAWSRDGDEVSAVVFASRLNYWTVPASLASPELRVWRLGGSAPEEIFRASTSGAPRLVGLDARAGLLYATDAALRVWSYRARGLVDETCRRITRPLTPEEWRALIGSGEPRATC